MTELTAGIGDNSTALDNVDRLAELAHEIKARSDRIEQRTRKTAEEMIEAGKLLLEAKELVKHGQFTKWIETNLNIPYSSAASWMTLAKHNRGDKLAQWLVDDLKKAPFARELMNPSEIIATFGPEEYGDDEDEDDLEPTQTGAEIQAGVFPQTEAAGIKRYAATGRAITSSQGGSPLIPSWSKEASCCRVGQLGKACLVGCDLLSFRAGDGVCRFGNVVVAGGEELSIDGGGGAIYRGRLPVESLAPGDRTREDRKVAGICAKPAAVSI